MTWPEISLPNSLNESIWTLYDLRDPEAWTHAGEERRAWGVEFADVHRPDNDHIMILFHAGVARRLAA